MKKEDKVKYVMVIIGFIAIGFITDATLMLSVIVDIPMLALVYSFLKPDGGYGGDALDVGIGGIVSEEFLYQGIANLMVGIDMVILTNTLFSIIFKP